MKLVKLMMTVHALIWKMVMIRRKNGDAGDGDNHNNSNDETLTVIKCNDVDDHHCKADDDGEDDDSRTVSVGDRYDPDNGDGCRTVMTST